MRLQHLRSPDSLNTSASPSITPKDVYVSTLQGKRLNELHHTSAWRSVSAILAPSCRDAA